MSSEDALLRTLLVVIATILLVPFIVMAFMMPMMGMGGHMLDGGMWNATGATWMWLLMWLTGLAVVVGLAYLLYRAIRRPVDRGTDTALEELRIAYARGELSDEEFEERRERLQRVQ